MWVQRLHRKRKAPRHRSDNVVEEKKECKTEVGPKILQPNPCKQEVNLEVNDDVLACEGLLMLHQSCKPKPQGVQ